MAPEHIMVTQVYMPLHLVVLLEGSFPFVHQDNAYSALKTRSTWSGLLTRLMMPFLCSRVGPFCPLTHDVDVHLSTCVVCEGKNSSSNSIFPASSM